MRRSKKERLDRIVWVDPQKYYECPYVKKPDIGRLIGRINQYYEEEDKKLMLLVPGRIGTPHHRNWGYPSSMRISVRLPRSAK